MWKLDNRAEIPVRAFSYKKIIVQKPERIGIIAQSVGYRLILTLD
jgi:hypothetical protein